VQIEQATGKADEKYFTCQDTRLQGPMKHPVVIKSVDIGADCGRPRGRMVNLDYGYGGDKHLYVEVAVYKPRKHIHWMHYVYDVQALIDGKRPESLRHLAKRLRVSQKFIVERIVTHMHLPN
jgi:hypothetical protein